MGKLIMFFAISYFLMSRFLNRVAKTNFPERPRQMLIGYLLLMAALYAWGALHFGSFAAVGVASLGGALLGMSDLGLKEKIGAGLGSLVPSIFAGLLLVVLGMEVNLKEVGATKIFLAILFGAVAGAKLMGVWIARRKVTERPGERFLISIGILPQGEMGMLIAAYLFSRGLLDPSSFNVAITTVVVLTMLTPVLMKVIHYSPSPSMGEGRPACRSLGADRGEGGKLHSYFEKGGPLCIDLLRSDLGEDGTDNKGVYWHGQVFDSHTVSCLSRTPVSIALVP
jgi:Kef-type K+ transport system membrane component KefB